MGNRPRRPARRTGHAERRRIPSTGNQHGGLHESKKLDSRVHRRLPWTLHQPEKPVDEFPADRTGIAWWYDGKLDGRPGKEPGKHQQEQHQEQQAVDDSRSIADQTVRRGRLRLATCRLSSIGNPLQPICQESRPDERDADGKGQRALEHDRRRYLGYDPWQSRTPAWTARA